MDIIVQKFGGTSLQSKATREHVLYHISHALQNQSKVIVVVSALGRQPAPYATDTLLKLVNYPQTNASNRELDLLMSCGEVISAVVVANELKEIGIKATAFTGAQAGIKTNENHMNAKIEHVNPTRIFHAFNTYDVIVVAGFQGETETGDITTIGRGGSDTTATALGVATGAKSVEIFTDVDGIMTADPRIVNSARVLSDCTYEETCNLAYQGAKVIHPRAVEIAMMADLPIHIRSTYKRLNGTLISNKSKKWRENKPYEKPITGIAHSANISQVKINRRDNPNFSTTKIFKALSANGISIDFINISPNQIAFTLPNVVLPHAEQILEHLDIRSEIIKNCAKVALVGAGMSGMPGIAAKVVSALAKQDVQILQAADSLTTIWVLVHEINLKTAVNALHETFKLSEGIPIIS